MDSFSTKTLNYLRKTVNKYYVYRLIDPRTLHTFYIGKGCDNRVFSHAKKVQSEEITL